MNPLAYPVSRIVGLEPRSATPAANTIPVAGSGGTIADGWLSSNVPRLDAANAFTADQSVNRLLTSGGTAANPSVQVASGTGVYSSAANTMELTTGGTRRGFLNAGGLTVTTEDSQGAFRHSTSGAGFGLRLQNTGTGGADYRIGVSASSWGTGGGRLLVAPDASSTGAILAIWEGKFGFGVGNYTPTCVGDFLGDTIRVRTKRTIASATSTGNQGDQCYDDNYAYWCSATNTWQRIIRQSIATPAQFTANQNNWAPTIAKVWRVSTDASRDLTGINIGQWGGDEHSIVNVGSNNVVLKHQDTNSTAAYRFISVTGADITLAAGEMALLWYDSTSLRWRIAKV